MQGQDADKANVISLFAAKKAQAEGEDKKPEGEAPSFLDVMKQNAKNKERLEKERNSANKSVLRSYRIKH